MNIEVKNLLQDADSYFNQMHEGYDFNHFIGDDCSLAL